MRSLKPKIRVAFYDLILLTYRVCFVPYTFDACESRVMDQVRSCRLDRDPSDGTLLSLPHIAICMIVVLRGFLQLRFSPAKYSYGGIFRTVRFCEKRPSFPASATQNTLEKTHSDNKFCSPNIHFVQKLYIFHAFE